MSVPAPLLEPDDARAAAVPAARPLEPSATPSPSSPDVARPPRAPAARPPGLTPPQADRRARRGSPLAFWILVALVATAMILGIASMSALLVQTSFTVDSLRESQETLARQHEVLEEQVAEASSPQRIMEWAKVRGMQMPDRVVILHLPAANEDGA